MPPNALSQGIASEAVRRPPTTSPPSRLSHKEIGSQIQSQSDRSRHLPVWSPLPSPRRGGWPKARRGLLVTRWLP